MRRITFLISGILTVLLAATAMGASGGDPAFDAKAFALLAPHKQVDFVLAVLDKCDQSLCNFEVKIVERATNHAKAGDGANSCSRRLVKCGGWMSPASFDEFFVRRQQWLTTHGSVEHESVDAGVADITRTYVRQQAKSFVVMLSFANEPEFDEIRSALFRE